MLLLAYKDLIILTFHLGLPTLTLFTLLDFPSNATFRDALITCVVNTCTCLTAGVLVFAILGYMAHLQVNKQLEVNNQLKIMVGRWLWPNC